MDADEENIYMTSIHDRYASCPESLENMCLAKFAVTYEPKYESSGAENDELNINENPDDDENEDDLNENDRNQFIKLKIILDLCPNEKKNQYFVSHHSNNTKNQKSIIMPALYSIYHGTIKANYWVVAQHTKNIMNMYKM